MHKRSIYRYLELLKEVGYLIDKDEHNRYFLIQERSRRSEQLGAEESYFLQDLLQQAAPEHPLTQRILAQLNQMDTRIPRADQLIKATAYRHVQLLDAAMQAGRCVLLKAYNSASSESISDRKVEPLQFSDNYTYLLAFDRKAAAQRQFKIDRIGSVELLEEPADHLQDALAVDAFGFSGSNWILVELRLSQRAFHLLLEEFPPLRAKPLSRQGPILFQGLCP